MAFTEPLDVFVNTADFADDGILGGAPVRLIFDRQYASVGESFGKLASSFPIAFLKSDGLQASIVGLPLQITTGPGLGSWRVQESEPDGAGMTVLMLEAA